MEKRHANAAPVSRTARVGPDDTDDGFVALRAATAAYTRIREELLEERAANAALHERVTSLEVQAEVLREQARADERRATALLSSVREMHRSLFHGTTWEHVLRAALDVTEAERGYYVSQEMGQLRVRATVDVPARVGDAPSAFIADVAHTVLSTGRELRWKADSPPHGLTPGPGERFREGVAVPVAIHGNSCGVIIALDRDGNFHDGEVASLLRIGTEASVAVENARLRVDLERAYHATISMLADTLSAKDPYTRGHCDQVSRYARLAASRLELAAEEQRITCYTALLHDIGKIGVSDGVLNKPGPLIAEERKLVEGHVRIGHDLIVGIPALRDVASAILHHHEWWDGSGYPAGLTGEDIPVASRIVAIVDAYCAMVDERSYKDAMPAGRAREELRRCAGTQFDPTIVDVVIGAITDAESADLAEGADAGTRATLGCGILPGMLS